MPDHEFVPSLTEHLLDLCPVSSQLLCTGAVLGTDIWEGGRDRKGFQLQKLTIWCQRQIHKQVIKNQCDKCPGFLNLA